MSKIFKISGNFVQHREWVKPSPSFEGEIVVDDANTFCGYCNELYDSDMPESNKVRFLAGAFALNTKNGNNGIAFYKLSNDSMQAPLMYVIPDLGTKNIGLGSWAALTPFGYFEEVSDAQIWLSEITTSNEALTRIKDEFNKIDKSINGNGELLKQVQCCIDIIVNS